MSLINEALKKAQRLRHEEGTDSTELAPSVGGHVSRRGKSNGANTMVLIGSGAIVLVVLSVVLTVYLLNRPAEPRVAATTPAAPVEKKFSPPPVSAEPSLPPVVVPPIVVPTITPPVSTPTPTEPPAPSAASTSPVNSTASSSHATPPPASASPAPAAPVAQAVEPPPPTLAPGALDERVSAFVEAVRVTGIRSSGADSRVLMNERVYRVNDIVERTLNVRLVKAEADSLTFSDSRGVTYVKRF